MAITFLPGNGPLTRLVKRLAKERGETVAERLRWNGWGYQIDRYEVVEAIYREAEATIQAKRAADDVREEARRRREEETRQRAWEEDLSLRFPRLRVAIPRGSSAYKRPQEVPINLMTRTSWRRLGCRVVADQTKNYLVTGGGGRVVPLFAAWEVRAVPSRRRNWTGARLWEGYQARGLSLAHAIWAANRLVKLVHADKRAFYALKDKFLRAHQDHLIEGRLVRTETSPCWCDGEDEYCYKCDGTGIYSQRTLYEHILNFDGASYSFHSYIRPCRLSQEKGADLSAYGRRLTRKDTIPYRIDEYVRMLGHCATSWQG